MKLKDIIKKIFAISAIIVGVFVIVDLILILRDYINSKLILRSKAERKLNSQKTKKTKQIEALISQKMDYFEKTLEKNGAVRRDEFNEVNREEFGERATYQKGDYFYRIDKVQFDADEAPYIVVSAIDKEKFAKVGIMEEIEAYPYDIPDERIEEVVPEILATEL